jgi:hypothetical protein
MFDKSLPILNNIFLGPPLKMVQVNQYSDIKFSTYNY